MYYPSSENKGADQLRGYREADLRLCLRICKKPVFSRRGSFLPRDQNFSNMGVLALLFPDEAAQAILCLVIKYGRHTFSFISSWKYELLNSSINLMIL